MLFDALNDFDLAAAFECCRIDYTASSTPYDATGFFRGWEIQTGVMALRRGERLDAFWQATMREYDGRKGVWSRKSSAEQGAATLALGRVDVRFLPLPPSFNARPFTMLSYIHTFGLPVYHGKELWKGVGLNGQTAHVEAIIAERMLRDWDGTRDILAAQFNPEHLTNVSRRAAARGWRRMHAGGGRRSRGGVAPFVSTNANGRHVVRRGERRTG